MCGCGRTSTERAMPCAKSTGPIRSKNTNGPTMRRFAKGSTRPTSKPPRSRRRASMTRSIMGLPLPLKKSLRSAITAPRLLQAELRHHAHHVVEEVLLDDLPVLVPSGHRAEVDFERFSGRRDRLAARAGHGSLHGAGEPCNGARPIARGEEHLVRPVPDAVIWKGLEHLDPFGSMIMDAM